ncbi:MAG: hypothetical protein NZV14_09050 [Bryobacteraceae bacterium]|nr:hypothetical protein [Bryobacteraceae bacterium]MDW8378297.1 hypothetical protein [Bryobacterales bacterium]
MNARLCWALVFSSSLPGVDGDLCQPCHPAVVQVWSRNGMGRSIQPASALSPGYYYHRRSNRHYRIGNGRIRRHQLSQGQEINVVDKTVEFLIGSGNHAYTPVHRSLAGTWIQSPVSWYRESASWNMSPGFDRPDHLDFRRPITPECLFCHSAYPRAGAEFPRTIDCDRCHGAPSRHLQEPRRGTILNPAALSRSKQLDICLQCHLETASQDFGRFLARTTPQRFLVSAW